MAEAYIKCPKCDLNYCTKKEKICASCKQKMKTISSNLLDAGNVAELGLCPICKINYVTDDETVCSTCYAETDLSDEEILEIYGENKPSDKEDDDEENVNDDTMDDDDLTPVDDDDLGLLDVVGIGADDMDDDDLLNAKFDDEEDDNEDDLDDEIFISRANGYATTKWGKDVIEERIELYKSQIAQLEQWITTF